VRSRRRSTIPWRLTPGAPARPQGDGDGDEGSRRTGASAKPRQRLAGQRGRLGRALNACSAETVGARARAPKSTASENQEICLASAKSRSAYQREWRLKASSVAATGDRRSGMPQTASGREHIAGSGFGVERGQMLREIT
jgi:hypothetical protein